MPNKVITLLENKLQSKIDSWIKLEQKDAFVSTLYKAESNKNSYLIKICPKKEHCKREELFLQTLQEKIPLPRWIATFIEEKTVVMQYLLGQNLRPNEASEKLLFQAGKLLATIHTEKTLGYGDLIDSQSLTDDPKVSFYAKFEEAKKECKKVIPPSFLDKIEAFFIKKLDTLTAQGSCIVHRDFRPANLLCKGDKIIGIVDWSSSRGGFAEEDLVMLENGEWPMTPIQKKAFLRGYKTLFPHLNYQEKLPLLLLNRAFLMIGFFIRENTHTARDARMYQKNISLISSLVR